MDPSLAQSDPQRELGTHRRLPAPPRRVFEAFADPDQLALWWGPLGFTNTIRQFDFRPGGTWSLVMHSPQGMDYDNESVFVEIVPDQRIVFDHVSPPHFRWMLSLQADGEHTEAHWLMRFPSTAARDALRAVIDPANEENLDRLTALLSRGK